MKKIILVLTLFLSAQAFAAEKAKRQEVKPETPKEPVVQPVAPISNEFKVGVKGMVCAFCAQGIEKKFKSQKEVDSIQVSLENKFVKLKFKDGQRLSNEKIAELLKAAGYEADFGGGS